MKAITSDEMRMLEKYAADLGLPSRVLMETAGMKTANVAVAEVKHAKSIVIVCGGGGNGGDGFVAARYLHGMGINVAVFLTASESKISGDSLNNLGIIKKLGLKIINIDTDSSLSELQRSLLSCDVVIDAIFGIGLKENIPSLTGKVIGLINNVKNEIQERKPYCVISVDVPSGVNATSGEVQGPAVEADITVTFEYPKIGLLKFPASKYAGKVTVAGIGIPKPNPIESTSIEKAPEYAPREPEAIEITDSKIVASLIPRRKVDAHKGSCGRVLVIAGSSGMMGAGVLTSNAALRTGSGLVTLCVPKELVNFVNTMSLELVVSDHGSLKEKALDSDVIAIGPGLGSGKDAEKLVMDILSSADIKVPIVIDADGLNAINDPSILKESGKNIVITPHPGEFARLTKRSIKDIESDRIGSAMDFASKYGVTVVLKGAYTVIAGSNGQAYINPIGNPAMATAGTGDVLCGVIASLIGQGLNGLNASVCGAYIHGMAANIATSIKGEYGLIASDIIENIPFTIRSVLQIG